MRLFIRGDHVAIGLLRLALIVEKVQDDLFLLLRLLRAVQLGEENDKCLLIY